LVGAVDLHGPSTDSLSAEATWSDNVDDLSRDAPHVTTTTAIAFRTAVRPYEEIALLASLDGELDFLQEGKVALHRARHEFHDTRHHVVDYRLRATTRYREFFAPALLQPGADPLDDGHSVVAPVVRVSVPSSAVPAAPIVHSVLPLFRWTDTSEPEQ